MCKNGKPIVVTAYSYEVEATDPDVGDTLTYSLTTAATYMTINATTVSISWTSPNTEGRKRVTASVQTGLSHGQAGPLVYC